MEQASKSDTWNLSQSAESKEESNVFVVAKAHSEGKAFCLLQKGYVVLSIHETTLGSTKIQTLHDVMGLLQGQVSLMIGVFRGNDT